MIFLNEFAFAFGVVLLFGLCGAGAIAPFMSGTRYGTLASPLAGMLLVPLGTLAVYVVLQTSIPVAATASIALCLILTALQGRAIKRSLYNKWIQLAVLGTTILVLTITLDAATLSANGIAFEYGDGTDQGGYGQLADWLLSGPLVFPVPSPSLPYQSWPSVMFAVDPRFGSFALLAIIAWLHGTSGIFSYDIACVIGLACGVLGVAAVFARNRVMLALLVLGLITAHWFDYSRTGFFGKVIGYPSALFIAGLIFVSWRSLTKERLFFLLFLIAAAAISYSGVALSALLVGIFAGAFLLSPFSFRGGLRDFGMLVSLTLTLPTVASGVLARPMMTSYPDFLVSWSTAIPRILDLDNQGVPLTGLPKYDLYVLTAIAFLIWAILLVAALRARHVMALGMIGGPALTLGILALKSSTAPVFQMIGYFYPAVLCGAVTMVQAVSMRTALVIGLIVASIGIREPRFIGAIERYAMIGGSPTRYTQSEIKSLVSQIGSSKVEIDVAEPQAGIVLLDEFGRRQLNLAWSERGWKTILGYRDWKPVPPDNATKILTLSPHPTMGSHFVLLPKDPDQVTQ